MTGIAYQVFLSYSSADKDFVRQVAARLSQDGVRYWFDEERLPPGERWQQAIEEVLPACDSFAAFFNATGRGPWQEVELRAAFSLQVSGGRSLRFIPVLLPGADASHLPLFLRQLKWVAFQDEPAAYEAAYQQLLLAIRPEVLSFPLTTGKSDSGTGPRSPSGYWERFWTRRSTGPREPQTQPSASLDRSDRLAVFLCHASQDKDEVRELYRRLCQVGVKPWLDEVDLIPGQDWESVIRQAVRASHVVVVCLSPNTTNKAGFVQKEIRLALNAADEQPEGAIFLIPLRLAECPVPDRLQRWHWCNLHEEKGFEKLILALRTRADSLGLKLSDQADAQARRDPGP